MGKISQCIDIFIKYFHLKPNKEKFDQGLSKNRSKAEEVKRKNKLKSWDFFKGKTLKGKTLVRKIIQFKGSFRVVHEIFNKK